MRSAIFDKKFYKKDPFEGIKDETPATAVKFNKLDDKGKAD